MKQKMLAVFVLLIAHLLAFQSAQAFPDRPIKLVVASPAGRVLPMPVTPLEISATLIRDVLAAGGDPRYLMPDAVLDDPRLLAPYRG